MSFKFSSRKKHISKVWNKLRVGMKVATNGNYDTYMDSKIVVGEIGEKRYGRIFIFSNDPAFSGHASTTTPYYKGFKYSWSISKANGNFDIEILDSKGAIDIKWSELYKLGEII